MSWKKVERVGKSCDDLIQCDFILNTQWSVFSEIIFVVVTYQSPFTGFRSPSIPHQTLNVKVWSGVVEVNAWYHVTHRYIVKGSFQNNSLGLDKFVLNMPETAWWGRKWTLFRLYTHHFLETWLASPKIDNGFHLLIRRLWSLGNIYCVVEDPIHDQNCHQ